MTGNKHSVAVLIDGGFFLKRYWSLMDPEKKNTPKEVALDICTLARRHIGENYLFKIIYYDCFPFEKKIQNPLTRRTIDYRKTEQYKFRTGLFEELKKKRKLAVRLGYIKDFKNWSFKAGIATDLIKGKRNLTELGEADVIYDLRQKGIDMKIGLDIATLAFKKIVSQIVLIAGDADFAPALKLARKEGIDIILDPMWNPIDVYLVEHIDGLRSTITKPPQH